jgi:hypothetical protein
MAQAQCVHGKTGARLSGPGGSARPVRTGGQVNVFCWTTVRVQLALPYFRGFRRPVLSGPKPAQCLGFRGQNNRDREIVSTATTLANSCGDGQGLPLLDKGRQHRRLMEQCRGLKPLRTAVVHPVDTVSLVGAVEAARERLSVPVLIGPEAKIRAAAQQADIDLSPFELIQTEHSHAAAIAAVAMAREGKVEALMKGALHTDELMHAVVDNEAGLRTARRISHVFAIDAPFYPRPLLVTDGAINVYPTLDEKRDIVQNAIDLAHALGIVCPKVAILSAVETVTDKIKSTLPRCARWLTAARSPEA